MEGQKQAQGRERAAASAPAASARRWRCIWRPPASARSASSISTSSTSATCSGRSCTARRTSAGRSCSRRGTDLQALNPHVQVETYETALTSDERPADLFKAYDIIIDGTDNFPTRYLVNDACVLLGEAERLRQHLPLRGPGVGVRDQGRARATAACIPSRRRPGWCRAAPRAACSASCRASSAASRRPRRIKLILGIGEPLIGRLPAATTRCG